MKTKLLVGWAGMVLGLALVLAPTAQAMDAPSATQTLEGQPSLTRVAAALERARTRAGSDPAEPGWRSGNFYRGGVAVPLVTRATGWRWGATPRSLSVEPIGAHPSR